MKLKSFFAASVEEALGQARREFGPEAVLVQSRRTPAEAKEFGEYEVVCALLEEDAASAAAPAETRESLGAPSGIAGADKVLAELADVKRCMQRLQNSILRGAVPAAGMPKELQESFTALLDADVDSELAERIVSEAGAHAAAAPQKGAGAKRGEARFSSLVHRHITRLAAARPDALSDDQPGLRTIALVGPPGAGKTACIAKMAARYGVARRKATHVISLDDYRIGGSEQLRAYAAVLGVSFEAVNHDLPLTKAFGEQHWKDLVLIDVPGFSASEMAAAADAAERLGGERVDTHLVLPASLRAADLRRIVAAYAIFRPANLIFTRLDETTMYGPILNETVRTGIPVSFLANGPRIPDDFEPATRSRIADLVLGGGPGRAKAISAAA
jgi:flagellar biosynthesis protein FlhF